MFLLSALKAAISPSGKLLAIARKDSKTDSKAKKSEINCFIEVRVKSYVGSSFSKIYCRYGRKAV